LKLQIVAVSGVLYWLLGVASLAGLVTVLGVLYVNHSLSSVVQKLQGQFMRLKDARMKRVAETFRAISLVKFNAWESRMANRIGTARDAEVASIRHYFRLDIARTVLTAGMPIFISVVTFAVYAGLLGHALTPALVFTSLSLFRLIQQPLRQIAGIYSTLIRVRVSADRIADFFALPELAPRSSSSYSREEDLVVVEDGAFGWDRSVDVAAAPLQRVNLRLRHDDLVVVHGPVGCGKSSLCAAILGEMTTLRGRVCVNASVAYCSQQPWIQNMTLRDNILFGTRWDETRYAAVLDACALTHDLASLPAGDLTEIGERGVNLSGGQKARVALARACYANADVYLLDAPLAAVDAIVANEIFQKCVLGLLRHKAVLLVTHNPEIMASPFVTMAVTVSPDGELQETVARRTTPPPEATIEPLPPKALVAEQRVDTATSDSTEAKIEPHKLVQKENREQGRVGASVFSAYYAAIGGFWIVLLVLATQAIQQILQVSGSFWLGHWSSSSVSTTKGLTVYTLLGGLAALLVFVQTLTVYLVGLRAAQSLFNRMTRALLHAPLGFFDATPIGRLLGRYAEDVSIVDFTLPTLFSGFIASLFTVASSLLTAAVVIQWRGLLLLPLVVIYARVGAFYIEPAREIERFHKTTWSPILSHLAASLEGAATVRAFGTKK
jgi:ABC-type multidrug transport system fused ATPase/permease subunit